MVLEEIFLGAPGILNKLPKKSWLSGHIYPLLRGVLASRIFWRVFYLSRNAYKKQCDILFVPGGSYGDSFHPVVTMSQNLLTFESNELIGSGFSMNTLKMLIWRTVRSWIFHRSEGVIFLTDYVKNAVLKVTENLRAKTAVIAHYLSQQFEFVNKMPCTISECSLENSFKLIYVSNVDTYKHQLPVLRAVERLRQKGYPLRISFIGPGLADSITNLTRALIELDPHKQWARYSGQVLYEQLQGHYTKANLGIFASSCKTFGIILLEKMAMGMPIASSNLSPMSEIL